MAEKRPLEAVGTVSCSKRPRLEAEPSHLLPVDLCKAGSLPSHAFGSHYGYRGSYFAYPLRYHDGPKPLTHWTPGEAYPPCPSSVASQQLQAEKALCMLYKQEAESFGVRGQSLAHEKGSECLAQEAFRAQERWANYMGYPGYVPQGWIQNYVGHQAPRVPTGCPTLAAPKPIYRHHIYSAESGYSLKGSLDLGMLAESTLKLPLDAEWSLPPLGPLSPICGNTTPQKLAPVETNFLQLLPGSKEVSASPGGFSPYHKSLEKCQGGKSASFLEGSYPNSCRAPKTISEAHGSNLGKQAWSKLPPPASPVAHPPPLMYQERSPPCYPLTSYPLTSQEQMLLYHPSYAQAEKPNSLLALPPSKGFGSLSSQEAPVFPGSYFSPTPRGYHAGHLENYPYKVVDPLLVTPPGLQSSREREHQQSSMTKTDRPQRTPKAVCAQPEKTSYREPLPSRDWDKGRRVMEQTNENVPRQQATPQSGAFQPLHSLDGSSGFLDGFTQRQESNCQGGPCPSEKSRAKEQEHPPVAKWCSLTPDAKKRNVDNYRSDLGACVVIPDSPATPSNSCCKPVQGASDIPESLNPCLQNAPQSPARDIIKTPPPPPSPPMPVINKVFSLAPYKDYLEGSTDSVEIPLPKAVPSGKTSPNNKDRSLDGPHSAQPDGFRASEEASGEKDVAHKATGESSTREPKDNCTEIKGGECVGTWDSFGTKLFPPNDSVSSQPASKSYVNGWSECGDNALDLSCKMEALVDTPNLQGENFKSNGAEVRGKVSDGPEALPPMNREGSELPVQSSSERRCNFQSSAAFLFKKFKIRKSQATEAGSPVQHPPSLSLLLSSQIAVLSGDFSLQHCSARVVVQENGPRVAVQSPPQEVTRQNSPTALQSPGQRATQQDGSPLQQSSQEDGAQDLLPAVQQGNHRVATPPENQLLYLTCFNAKLPETSKSLLPSTPAVSPVPGKAKTLLPGSNDPPGQPSPPGQYFTDLHTSVCTIISCSVSATSPEQLKEWLEKAESDRVLKEKTTSLAKPKNGVKASSVPKPSKGKQIWLAFTDVVALFRKLLSQLDTFLLTHKCPFPHVVRAGAIFIPIHVVKEKLFPNLSGTSVDHVLQDHKVELRPTTLSEEKLLRDLELKSCTSRMLKLLALKQLPDIYPDLLTLHWHDCVKQQLNPSSQADLQASK